MHPLAIWWHSWKNVDRIVGPINCRGENLWVEDGWFIIMKPGTNIGDPM